MLRLCSTEDAKTKEDADSPVSNNNLNYIHYPSIFACGVSVYKHFSLFQQTKKINCLSMYCLSVVI